MKTVSLYDVVIYRKSTRTVTEVIGVNMVMHADRSTRNTASLRVSTGLTRINEHYGCAAVPAGEYTKGSTIPKRVLHL